VATKQSGLESGGLRCLEGTSTIGLPTSKLDVCRRSEAARQSLMLGMNCRSRLLTEASTNGVVALSP